MSTKQQKSRIGAGLTLFLSLVCLSSPAAAAETRSTLSVRVDILPACEVSARNGQASIRCTGVAPATTTTRSSSSPLARAADQLVEARADADRAGTTWVTVSY